MAHCGQMWTDAEIALLLNVWSEDSIQRQLQGALHNEIPYRKIAAELENAGYNRTFKQCREKIKALLDSTNPKDLPASAASGVPQEEDDEEGVHLESNAEVKTYQGEGSAPLDTNTPSSSHTMQGSMWPWILLAMVMWSWISILLVIAQTSAVADGRYTYDDIQSIVVNHAMQFWDFPRARGYSQYGVLIPLPVDKRSRLLLHPYPKIQKHYNRQLYHTNYKDMLVGTNFAVARPSNGGDNHTEAQLLNILSIHQSLLGGKSAVLLYTKGTPCKNCTDDIVDFVNRYRSMVAEIAVDAVIAAITLSMNRKLGFNGLESTAIGT